MTRYVITVPVTIPASGYGQPARVLPKGTVVDLSPAEVTTIGAGNMRVTLPRDFAGEEVGVSN